MYVRNATPDDAEEISGLLIALAKKFIVPGFQPVDRSEGEKLLLGAMTPDEIRDRFASGYRYHVGVTEGKIVCVVGTRENNHLYHLFVGETHQGKGYARLLWDIGKAACLSENASGYFTVNASLNAVEVYRHWGFVPTDAPQHSGGVISVPMRLDRVW